MKIKKNIVISFSGGETSAYMMWHIIKNYPSHNIKVVFANTGEENERTLEFVQRCSDFFNVEIIWLEYERLGFKQVDFESAYRSHDPIEVAALWPNHPFRKMIAQFGIPNQGGPFCSRELKAYVINRYLSTIGWKPSNRTMAIGIRADEIDRIGEFWYPLVEKDITKPMVNLFWSKMPFRLGLKGYEGNCKTCWKKSTRKLVTIARHNPSWFDFMRQMEIEYGGFIPESKKKEGFDPPIRFFRGNKTTDDIMEMAKDLSIEDAIDDSLNTNYQTSLWHDGTELDTSNGCSESCEIEY